MIGLGKWECVFNTFFFKGKIQIEIKDNNGKYAFDFKMGNSSAPPYTITSIKEENGNTLIGTGYLNAMPDKKLTARLTFTDENHCSLEGNAPFVGTLRSTDGYRIK